MLALLPRFMAWKLASAFVLTAETWLGPERTRSGEEAVLTIGVSRRERLGVIRRIRRTPALAFAPPEWLAADALDESYFRLLPAGVNIIMADEAAMLASCVRRRWRTGGAAAALSAELTGIGGGLRIIANYGTSPRPMTAST